MERGPGKTQQRVAGLSFTGCPARGIAGSNVRNQVSASQPPLLEPPSPTPSQSWGYDPGARAPSANPQPRVGGQAGGKGVYL